MSDTAPKEKSFIIKVPVYTTKILEKNNLFHPVTYTDMISYVNTKVDEYSKNNDKVKSKKRTKVREKQIDRIKCINKKIGDVPVVLLQITASNSNLCDGFLQAGTKIEIKEDYKLGSDNIFVLLYPNLIGNDPDNYRYQWLIFVYEDPSKENEDIVNTAKLVAKKVLGLSLANIKLKDVLSDLKMSKKVLPELQVSLSAMSNKLNLVDPKYESFQVSGKSQKVKVDVFKEIPIDCSSDLIEDCLSDKDYDCRSVKMIVGKREYKIVSKGMLKDAKNVLSRATEEIFNTSINVSQSDMSKIFEEDFIITKLTPVLHSYLS